MIRQAIGVLLAGSLLAGCATIRTEHGASASGGEGLEYGLPLGEFKLSLVEDEGEVAATLDGPFPVKDSSARYRTAIPSSWISNNDFTIDVNERGLLSSFAGYSEGRLGEIAETLAKSIAYQSAGERQTEPFYTQRFLLGEVDQVVTDANKALSKRKDTVCRETPSSGRCKSLRAKLTEGFINLDAVVLGSRHVPHTMTTPTKPRTGRVGNVLYYRPLKSVRLDLGLGGDRKNSFTFQVPDETQTNWVRVTGGVFAKQEYDYIFADGVLMKDHRIVRNEVEGLVNVPLRVAKAIIAAPAEALKDKQAVIEAQTEYLEKTKELAKQIAEAKAACAEVDKVCQDLPYRSLTVSTEDKVPDAIASNKTTPGNQTPGNAAGTEHSSGDQQDDDDGAGL